MSYLNPEALSERDADLVAELLERNNWQGLLAELIVQAQLDLDDAAGQVEEELLAPRRAMIEALQKAEEQAKKAGD